MVALLGCYVSLSSRTVKERQQSPSEVFNVNYYVLTSICLNKAATQSSCFRSQIESSDGEGHNHCRQWKMLHLF